MRLDRLDEDGRVTALALRCRGGEQGALGDLYGALESLVRGCLRRYRSGRGRPLPTTVEPEDLWQQAYLLVAEAVAEWEPGRGGFVPYFLGSFPWRVQRYLRSQTPLLRSARYQFRTVPHDELVGQMDRTAGLDGREWAEALGLAELTSELPGLDGEVVRLHLYHGLPFAEVARALGISRSAAHRAFVRGIACLRGLCAESEGTG